MSETAEKLVDDYNTQCDFLVKRDKSYYADMLQEAAAAAAGEGRKILCHKCNVEYGRDHTDACCFKDWARLWVELSVSEELA